MIADDELQELMHRVRSWYQLTLRDYKKDLPAYEYGLAHRACIKLLRRASKYYAEEDLSAMRSIVQEILYFTTPWEVTVWYAINKKK